MVFLLVLTGALLLQKSCKANVQSSMRDSSNDIIDAISLTNDIIDNSLVTKLLSGHYEHQWTNGLFQLTLFENH
jgi:hypothetical protein